MMILNDLTLDHLPDFYRWISNKISVKYSLSSFLPNRDIKWAKEYLNEILADEFCWNQAIVVNGVSIGYCGLCKISRQNNNAEYFILIGDNSYWGKGFGTQAGHDVLRYGFETLKLHRIWLTVSECNNAAIRSYLKIGFTEEGRMREACYRSGNYYDKIVMSILSNEVITSNECFQTDAQKTARR